MWQDKLKEIIYILENSNVNEIEVNFWGRKYRVSKQANVVVQDTSIPTERSPKSVQEYHVSPKESEASESTTSNNEGNEELLSPMPGTFYSSPTPDDPSFVNVGDVVKKGQTLCIIEAMKLMNELEAEVAGTVVEICAENAQPVEFGQVLFIVDPA